MARLETSSSNGHGAPVLSMIGEFDLSNVEPLKDCLAKWILDGVRDVVIDMTQTEFIDSRTISALVRAHLSGLRITVRGASDGVRQALEVAGINEVLTVEPGPGRDTTAVPRPDAPPVR